MRPCLREIHEKLDRIDDKLNAILRQQSFAEHEMTVDNTLIQQALADQSAAIAAEETVIGSVTLLLQTLEAQVRAIPTDDPAATAAAIHAVADNIRAQTGELAVAVAANTETTNTTGDPVATSAPTLFPVGSQTPPAQQIPPANGGVTTDPVTGALVADPSIPPATALPTSIPATPGDPADPLPAGDVPTS